MRFTLLSDITDIETFAEGRGIRELDRLKKMYGDGYWRKRKGLATVLLEDGTAHRAELHWYEEHRKGQKLMKIKRLLD